MIIKEIKNSKQLWPLRNLVLWQHKNLLDCGIDADTDPGTFHIGAIDENDNIIGIATFIKESNQNLKDAKQYRLRAMATHPTTRGHGLGKKIIGKAIEKLNDKNIETLWCDARVKACGFYENINFKIKGDIYEVPEIGAHKLMYIEIKK